eukprot:353758-Chlamydomonas_euryale.AAC.7
MFCNRLEWCSCSGCSLRPEPAGAALCPEPAGAALCALLPSSITAFVTRPPSMLPCRCLSLPFNTLYPFHAPRGPHLSLPSSPPSPHFATGCPSLRLPLHTRPTPHPILPAGVQ